MDLLLFPVFSSSIQQPEVGKEGRRKEYWKINSTAYKDLYISLASPFHGTINDSQSDSQGRLAEFEPTDLCLGLNFLVSRV